MIEYIKDKNNIVTLSINRTDTPVNAICEKFIDALDKNFNKACGEKNIKGIVITSSKEEFVVGADLTMIQRVKTVEESRSLLKNLHQVLRKMEGSQIPTVAAINGTALGGGYEICLACHYRIATNNSKIQIGLPEVGLGLLPGGGGTQRLPRLIGYKKALPYMLQGTKVGPQKALDDGLVNELASSNDDLISRAKNYLLDKPRNVQPWDEEGYKIPGGNVATPAGYQFFPATTAMIKQKTYGNYPAPLSIVSCVYEGLQVSFEQGLEIESRYFTALATGKVSQNMIKTLFFGINGCKKRPKGEVEIKSKPVEKVGILGAGMMGAGIAYASARVGIPVVLKDISKEVADKGKYHVEKVLDKGVLKKKITTEEKNKILEFIKTTDNPDHVKDCNLIIEAVVEDREIKAKVTEESEKVTDTDTIFSSNTSTLPITGLAEKSKRPENFIGLHFFSPVEKMPLVEIIMGKKTSKEALAVCLDYVKKIKKTPIVVNDGRGFYTSRIFTTYIEEGIHCLKEGISPALIENAGLAAGMPTGPLAVADEVSLDLIYHVIKQTKADLGDKGVDHYFDESIAVMVEKLGRLGRKVKKGFYEYPEDGKKYLWPGLSDYFPLKDGISKNKFEEVKKRILYRQSLEAIRCLEENIITSPRDADVGSILGWGFPAYTGGAISFVDFIGVKNFLIESKNLYESYGERFRVPQLLIDKDSKNESFL